MLVSKHCCYVNDFTKYRKCTAKKKCKAINKVPFSIENIVLIYFLYAEKVHT